MDRSENHMATWYPRQITLSPHSCLCCPNSTHPLSLCGLIRTLSVGSPKPPIANHLVPTAHQRPGGFHGSGLALYGHRAQHVAGSLRVFVFTTHVDRGPFNI